VNNVSRAKGAGGKRATFWQEFLKGLFPQGNVILNKWHRLQARQDFVKGLVPE